MPHPTVNRGLDALARSSSPQTESPKSVDLKSRLASLASQAGISPKSGKEIANLIAVCHKVALEKQLPQNIFERFSPLLRCDLPALFRPSISSVQRECRDVAFSLVLAEAEKIVRDHGTGVPIDARLRRALPSLVHGLSTRFPQYQVGAERVRSSISESYLSLLPLLEQASKSPAESQVIDFFNGGGSYEEKLPGLGQHTLVRTPSGNGYELVNRLTRGEYPEITQRYGVSSRASERGVPVIFGEGSFGKVRAALDKLGNLVAVKKMRCTADAKREIVGWNKVFSRLQAKGQGDWVVKLIDSAIVNRMSKYYQRTVVSKAYLFYEWARGGDGKQIAKDLQELARRGDAQSELVRLHVAQQYCQALAALHEVGFAHLDVKPVNVLARERIIDCTPKSFEKPIVMLSDVSDAYSILGSLDDCMHTLAYLPPEANYPTDYCRTKHDAFALGLSLAEMFGMREIGNPKTFNSKSFKLTLTTDTGITQVVKVVHNPFTDRCNGISAPEAVQYARQRPTLENIVAALLQNNPHDRMSPREAEILLGQAIGEKTVQLGQAA